MVKTNEELIKNSRDQNAIEFGNQIRAVRTEKGVSLRHIARLLEVAPSTLSRWERGEGTDAAVVQRVYEALGVDYNQQKKTEFKRNTSLSMTEYSIVDVSAKTDFDLSEFIESPDNKYYILIKDSSLTRLPKDSIAILDKTIQPENDNLVHCTIMYGSTILESIFNYNCIDRNVTLSLPYNDNYGNHEMDDEFTYHTFDIHSVKYARQVKIIGVVIGYVSDPRFRP